MENSGAKKDQRNQVLDNGRGYQTRGRSVNPDRGYFNAHADNPNFIPEENLKLVPCRWSHTGWKYVQNDPGTTHFFQSPNRVNSFGFSQGQGGTMGKPKRQTQSINARDGLFTQRESEFQTSYNRFFNPAATADVKSWKQKFNNADYGAHKGQAQPKDEQLIQWAGGLHQRKDFNKRKDPLGQWTEVMFHH